MYSSILQNNKYCYLTFAGETPKDPGVDRNTSVKKEKSGPDPIIIPIVLKMADFDHKVWPHSFVLQDWGVCVCVFGALTYYLKLLGEVVT